MWAILKQRSSLHCPPPLPGSVRLIMDEGQRVRAPPVLSPMVRFVMNYVAALATLLAVAVQGVMDQLHVVGNRQCCGVHSRHTFFIDFALFAHRRTASPGPPARLSCFRA